MIKKIAYLECSTGIAGDMCLGALVDVGVSPEYLTEQLQKLGLEQEYRLRVLKVHRNGQLATKVEVDLLVEEQQKVPQFEDTPSHTHPHHLLARHLPQIERLIFNAALPPRASNWSLNVFRQLAIAEGAVHGVEPEQVHFHEVGATDAIVDIVGTCLGLDWLGIDELYCSPMPTGGGTVKAAHGRMPVPVPAVLKLWELRGVPVYSNGIERELVTPTGAAIATTLAEHFGPPPVMKLERVGLGAGTAQLSLPNILRLWLGIAVEERLLETVSVLQTQIDDCSPQAIAYASEALFQVGALDVFTQAITMKKSRTGILLTVICPPMKVAECETVLFQETTTLGIRHLTQPRTVLQREIQPIQTSLGIVRVKVARRAPDQIVNVQPEYEDCALLAQQHQIPWLQVHQLALEAWHQQSTQC